MFGMQLINVSPVSVLFGDAFVSWLSHDLG